MMNVLRLVTVYNEIKLRSKFNQKCNGNLNESNKTLLNIIFIVENCLYGDSQGVVFTYSGKKITCSFDDINNDPSVCYYVENKCCQQCKNFLTGISGLRTNLNTYYIINYCFNSVCLDDSCLVIIKVNICYYFKGITYM